MLPIETNYAILGAIQSISSPLLDGLFTVLTFLGNPGFWILIAALVYWRGAEKKSFFIMNLIAISGALVSLFKIFFAIPRPSPEHVKVLDGELLSKYSKPGFDFSFPSGHTTLATAAYFHLSSYVQKHLKTILFIVLVLVAFSRMYLGKHFITDILGGIILGYFIGKINFALMKRLEKANFKLTKLKDEIGLVVTLIFASIVLAIFEPPALVMIIFGYYAGFFLFKEQGRDSPILIGKELLVKEVLGVAGLGLLAFPAIFLDLAGEINLVIFFTAGFWISYLYPMLYEKILKRRTA